MIISILVLTFIKAGIVAKVVFALFVCFNIAFFAMKWFKIMIYDEIMT